MSDPTSLSDGALDREVASLRTKLAASWQDPKVDADDARTMAWRLRTLVREQQRRLRAPHTAAGRRLG